MSLAKPPALAVASAVALGIGLLARAVGTPNNEPATAPAVFVELPQASDGEATSARPRPTAAPASGLAPPAASSAAPGPVPTEDPYAG